MGPVLRWDTSPDGLTWTFRLREGLRFHDGSPVRAEDAVASMKRWDAKITGAKVLMSRIAQVNPKGDSEFVIALKTKYPPMIRTLANSDQPLFALRRDDPSEVVGPNGGLALFMKTGNGSRCMKLTKNPDGSPAPAKAVCDILLDLTPGFLPGRAGAVTSSSSARFAAPTLSRISRVGPFGPLAEPARR